MDDSFTFLSLIFYARLCHDVFASSGFILLSVGHLRTPVDKIQKDMAGMAPSCDYSSCFITLDSYRPQRGRANRKSFEVEVANANFYS
jgi:predicted SAM-dependent methyltransferase